MKALSLTRPWPELILRCGKRVENRTWGTGYRGAILLHAAKSWQPDAFRFAGSIGQLGENGVSQRAADHPTGIVAVAELVGVCADAVLGGSCRCGPWAFPGQCHWHLVRVRRFVEPVAVSGRLGLWDVPPDLVPAVEAALRATIAAVPSIPTEPVTAAHMAAAGLPWGADAAKAGVVLP